MTTTFASYPSAFVYPRPNAKPKEWIDYLLSGDLIRLEGEEGGHWVKVHARCPVILRQYRFTPSSGYVKMPDVPVIARPAERDVDGHY